MTIHAVAHADDIPTSLRFDAPEEHAIRANLGLSPEAPLPDGLFALVDDASRTVLAVALLMDAGDASPAMGHRLTTVAREHRGRGLATAIKVELIRWAAGAGVAQLVASNDARNAAMRSVNDRLGYEPMYRIVLMRRALD